MNIFEQRVKKVQELMATEEIDVILILSLENYVYFTGDLRKQPRLLIPKEGEPATIVFASEKEEAAQHCWVKNVITYRALHEMMMGIIQFFNSLGIEKPRVGMEMEFSTPAFLMERFKMANPNVEIVDAKPAIAPLRKFKDEEEISKIRKACQIADIGMETAVKTIKDGVREIDIAIEAEYQMKRAGAERIAFPIFVNSGYRSLWLHGMATPKRIEKGDLILIDLGPVYQGYCADICRTVTLGKPNEKQKEIHSLYVQMEKTAIDSIKSGIKVFEVEEDIHQLANKAGYGEYYIRGFMHGIGLGFEEVPFPTIFAEDIMEEILPNMTLAVGHSVLSVPEIGGVRVEDTILFSERGVEILTHYPRELKEVA